MFSNQCWQMQYKANARLYIHVYINARKCRFTPLVTIALRYYSTCTNCSQAICREAIFHYLLRYKYSTQSISNMVSQMNLYHKTEPIHWRPYAQLYKTIFLVFLTIFSITNNRSTKLIVCFVTKTAKSTETHEYNKTSEIESCWKFLTQILNILCIKVLMC